MTNHPVLNDVARALFEPVVLGTLSTINPDGGPQVTLVAAFLDGDELVHFHRGWYQKLRNIERNPKVAFTIVPPADGLGTPGDLQPYLVVHGIARIQVGDAGPWSDRLLDLVEATLPPEASFERPEMPADGGWTTHITPTKIVGVGPWMS